MLFFGIFALGALGWVAGVTAGKLIDKTGEQIATVGGLLPRGSLDIVPNNSDGKIAWGKIIAGAVLAGVGVLVVKWVGKKLHVKILK